MKNRKFLFITSLLITIYLFVAIPYYYISGDSLEGHVIFGAIYFSLLIIHGIVTLIAVVFQWLGFLSKSRGWIIFANWILFIGGLPFFISLIGIIPLMIINRIALGRKTKIKNPI